MNKRVYTQTFGVVGAILEHEGKFLLIKEANKHEDSGKWSHPAGWIDVGENPLDAAKREALEESGFDITLTKLLGVYSLVRRDVQKIRKDEFPPHGIKLIFTGTIHNFDNPHPLHEDSTETRWFTPEEIYAMPPAEIRDGDIKQMVRDAVAGKGFDLSAITHTVQE